MEIIRDLVQQGGGRTSHISYLMYIWSLSALILSSIFSGAILEFIVNRKEMAINSLDDLIHSNLSVVTHEYSWLWWQFEKEKRWNVSLDYYLSALKDRLVSVPQHLFDNDKVFTSIYHVKPGGENEVFPREG